MTPGRERQAAYRERNRAGGLVSVTVLVPADRADDLRAVAAEMRAGRAPRAARHTAADDAQHALDLDALACERCGAPAELVPHGGELAPRCRSHIPEDDST